MQASCDNRERLLVEDSDEGRRAAGWGGEGQGVSLRVRRLQLRTAALDLQGRLDGDGCHSVTSEDDHADACLLDSMIIQNPENV